MGAIGEKLSLSTFEAVREIKDRVTTRDVAIRLGRDIERGYVRCGTERTPSCFLYDKGYKCFSCGRAGDVIDFYCHETGLDFMSAVKEMDAIFNIHILDTALNEYEMEKIKQERERIELRRAYAEFWVRRGDHERRKILSRLNTLEMIYFRLKPKYRSQIYSEDNDFQIDLFLLLEQQIKEYNEILDCLDEVQVETRFDPLYGFAYDKDMAKKRHWSVLKAIVENEREVE